MSKAEVVEVMQDAIDVLPAFEEDVKPKSKGEVLDAHSVKLQDLGAQVRAAITTQNDMRFEIGGMLAEAHKLVVYKRENTNEALENFIGGGWAGYVRDFCGMSEWNANRYRSAFELRQKFPKITEVELSLDSLVEIHKATKDGDKAKVIKRLEAALNKGSKSIKSPKNSEGKAETLKLENFGGTNAEVKGFLTTLEKGPKVPAQPPAGGEVPKGSKMNEDIFDYIKDYIETAPANDFLVAHLRHVWKLCDDNKIDWAGNSKFAKALRSAVTCSENV